MPHTAALPDDVYAARHTVVASTLFLLGPFLLVVGVLNGKPTLHVLQELGLVIVGPACAMRALSQRRVKALAAAFALMGSAALLVHFTGGLIEAHFMFFVLLPLVALYQDWVVFLAAIGFVVVHHALIGTLDPKSAFNNPAAIAHPILWALIHASFVTALVVVLIVYWYFASKEQTELADALDNLRQTQAELLQAQKLESIGALAAGVAHEINTPIQFVGDNLRFLHNGFEELVQIVERQSEMLERARTNSDDGSEAEPTEPDDVDFLVAELPLAVSQSIEGIERVAEIVRALKGVAHPGSDTLTPVDINKLLADTIVVSRNEWKYVAELESDLDPDVGFITCAAGPLHQVFLNMIINAAHAIETRFNTQTDTYPEIPGRILVSSRRLADAVELRITDNGCGIDEDNRTRIFDPFFTTKEVGKGSGQGLAISRSVITNQHRGTIDVESDLNVGTTFVVVLPIAQHAAVSI